MDLYEAIEIICDDYCKYPDVYSGNQLADKCDMCPFNKCEELRWAERKTEPMKTKDYCDICKRDMCEDCIADATNPYCVPSHYEINYEPKDEPKTQMKTQNSNLTFEKVIKEIQTQEIEFPDTHQKFIFARKIERDGDCINIYGWEYKGVKGGEREGE